MAITSNGSLKDLKPYQEMTGLLWLFVIQGILLVIGNSIIFISILYHELLRSKKEYTLPALLAFRDAADGLAAIFFGLSGNWLIYNGRAGVLVSRWKCLFTPWNFLWIFATHTTESTFLMISIDRLIAVGWPLFHYGLTKSYSNMMVLLAVSPAFIGYTNTFTYTFSHDNTSNISSLCSSLMMHSESYYRVKTVAKTMVALLSVVLYIPVIILYTQHNSDVSGVHGVDKTKYIKSQRKFTITLGISCLFTTVLYVVPTIVSTVVQHFQSITSSIGSLVLSWAYITKNINKIVNIFLYSLRHRNLRLGIKFLFMRKQLTMQAIQNVNAIVPMNVASPYVQANNHIAHNHQHIALAVPGIHQQADRGLAPLQIRRPVMKQRSTRV